MRLLIRNLVPTDVLAGSLAGQRLLARMIAEAPRPLMPGPYFLDFKGVSAATASFLRESVVAFRDYCRQRSSFLYPVVANPSEEVREELDFYLRSTNDVMLCCTLGKSERVTDSIFLGGLDQKALVAFDAIRRLGEADASSLRAKFAKTDPVNTTAWNNRLSNLATRGLVIEESKGRTKVYRTVLSEA